MLSGPGGSLVVAKHVETLDTKIARGLIRRLHGDFKKRVTIEEERAQDKTF